MEHAREKSKCQQIVSLLRDMAIKALGPIVIPSLLKPSGGSGSEEGNQLSPEANLWDKTYR